MGEKLRSLISPGDWGIVKWQHRVFSGGPTVNVAAQRGRPGSILEHYRVLLTLRRRYEVLRRGNLKFISSVRRRADVVAYSRSMGSGSGERALIVVNPSDEAMNWPVPRRFRRYCLAYGNYQASSAAAAPDAAAGLLPEAVAGKALILEPWEARVYLA